ncbi:hypothetical protein Q0590_06040 [Rhodocytophaga aerolata]|uniref:Uncharacterized protein n=1 Tax=Rhodocytophaga aerolata TaxID=455078 RepID=A0ABT8R137_9BACT|nr:hypothetical protein [Rhodocytophaga aerolata]MDO1445801.1 hypothetical protein [Rhodocytophaga aerolata]
MPPRTEHKVARRISQLHIEDNTQINKFDEQWTPNGDGGIFIELSLSKSQQEAILEQVKRNSNYKLFHQGELPFIEVGQINLDTIKEGYYMLSYTSQDESDFNFVLVDVSNREIIIQTLIQ